MSSQEIQREDHNLPAFGYFCAVNICRSLSATLIILLLLTSRVVSAQQRNDTLKEVEIRSTQLKDTAVDKRTSFGATQASQKIDRIYKDLYESQSLANLLTQQSSVFIKSYGVNSMSTLSLRGASAAQSSVLWNGIPITNPTVGMADLSLLQTGMFQDITLQYGSSAALYGSGNIGGALLLDNAYPDFNGNRHLAVTAGAGSYGAYNTGVKGSFSNNRWNISLNGFYQRAANDFSYKNADGQKQQLDNARLEGGGALLSADYNLKKNWDVRRNERLYLKLWWQSYDRQIPPALFETLSTKEQLDASLKATLGYEKNTRRSTVYAKGFYGNDALHYTDSVATQDYRNRTHNIYGEAGWKYRLDNPDRNTTAVPDVHQLMVFVPFQLSIASGDNISNRETQARPALAAAYSYEGFHGRLKANASVRQEWINGANAPLLPGAGISYALWQDQQLGRSEESMQASFLLRANVQRTYRVPTLNELYYFPGGNPSLKPEQGWSQDAGYTLQLSKHSGSQRKLALTHELNGFNRDIKDWIYWLGGAIWTPHNIAKVHSRGLETSNRLTYAIGELRLNIGLNYTYVLSTTEDSYLPGDGSIGKQIPYTPRYNVQGNAGAQWRGLFLNFNQTYTGYRFVTTDESQYLEPYALSNIQASYGCKVSKRYYVTLTGQVQNLFNRSYEVVNARPMPGRNFLLQLRFGL